MVKGRMGSVEAEKVKGRSDEAGRGREESGCLKVCGN